MPDPKIITALEAAVRNKVVNNWATGGATICLVCGELPESGLHDDDCWVQLANEALAETKKEPLWVVIWTDGEGHVASQDLFLFESEEDAHGTMEDSEDQTELYRLIKLPKSS